MASCSSFALCKALIIHQEEYQLAQLMFDDLKSLPGAKKSVSKAIQMAKGLGILTKDIIQISDMTAA